MSLKSVTDLLSSEPIRSLLYAAAILFLFLLPLVTYLIWWLRRFLGWMQSRIGPNRVGPAGLLQTPADAMKLLLKEDIIPAAADRWVFTVAPAITFIPAFLVYAVVPFTRGLQAVDLSVGVLYLSAIGSVGVIGIISGGWASNNKYALLGAMRSAAQMVSYEIPLVLAMMSPVVLAGTLSMRSIVATQSPAWFILILPTSFLLHFIASMAENNVTPFDMVEAESELVAGFNVEYSGMKFALFFLAEFANTITLAAIGTTLFLGGWHGPLSDSTFSLLGVPLGLVAGAIWFSAKTGVLVTTVLWVRGTLPRIRVDQLMDLGWKALIPLTLLNLVLTALWVALDWPLIGLAVLNWLLLLGTLARGWHKQPERAVEFRP
ncbi:MAG TPA: NADH-quinone oxidoreductase subunit NuoH [Armatimonadota bacterium]